MLKGGLFTRDFLIEGVRGTAVWQRLDDASLAGLRDRNLGGAPRTGARPRCLEVAKARSLSRLRVASAYERCGVHYPQLLAALR